MQANKIAVTAVAVKKAVIAHVKVATTSHNRADASAALQLKTANVALIRAVREEAEAVTRPAANNFKAEVFLSIFTVKNSNL